MPNKPRVDVTSLLSLGCSLHFHFLTTSGLSLTPCARFGACCNTWRTRGWPLGFFLRRERETEFFPVRGLI